MNIIYRPFTQRLEKVDAYVRQLLKEKLPKNLLYHNADHTLHPIQGVISVADMLAREEGISKDKRELVVTAAYLHDTGFVKRPYANEEIGVEIAYEVLPGFGYAPQELRKIAGMILATAILSGAKPKTQLEMILCDADSDNLGRDDFFEKGELYRKELGIEDAIKWYEHSIKFLEGHQFYTTSAQRLRNAKKAENLAKLKEMIGETYVVKDTLGKS